MKTIASQWLEASNEVTWLVAEQDNRWSDAARRFSPEELSDPWIPRVVSCEPSEVPRRISRHPLAKSGSCRRMPIIVLWELTPASIAKMLRVVTQVKTAFPGVIQIAGMTGIPGSMQATISELGIPITLAAPEALQNVARRINSRAFRTLSPSESSAITSALEG